MDTIGRHVILELYDCPAHTLDDIERVEAVMKAAAAATGATVVTANFHHFAPWGVSGVVIIQESHLTIHTWPEHGYAAIDIFTCGEIDLFAGVAHLERHLQASRKEVRLLKRGKINSLPKQQLPLK